METVRRANRVPIAPRANPVPTVLRVSPAPAGRKASPIRRASPIRVIAAKSRAAPPQVADVHPVAQKVVGTKQDTFTLDEGPVVLQWPSQLSETSYEDFKDWIELQLRKIKRSIQ